MVLQEWRGTESEQNKDKIGTIYGTKSGLFQAIVKIKKTGSMAEPIMQIGLVGGREDEFVVQVIIAGHGRIDREVLFPWVGVPFPVIRIVGDFDGDVAVL